MSAPDPAVVETVARAMFDADAEAYGWVPSYYDYGSTADRYRRHAAAAIAALPPSPAEEAVKRAIHTAPVMRFDNDYPVKAVPVAQLLELLAALASPAPAPQGEEGGAWRWQSPEPGSDDEWEQVWTCCGGPFSERPSGHYADCPAIGGCTP